MSTTTQPTELNCWLWELLDRGMECDPPKHNTTQQFFYRGIDIGTGATCIYPLLLSTPVFSGTEKSTTQWKFLATDVDPTSVQSAIQNIKASNSPTGDVIVQRTLDELTQYVCQTSRYWRRLQAKTKQE
jgi:23S rRNA A1618 N6-methylase RlmF